MGGRDGAGKVGSAEVLEDLVRALVERRSPAVVLSGAGISVSSDIPAFRGRGGLWSRYDPMEYATIDAFRADPAKVWTMLWELDAILEAAAPNAAHRAIAELQQLGAVSAVVTQNIDGLHQAAGSDEVVELHGSRQRLVCLDGDLAVGRRDVAEAAERGAVPCCGDCGAALKPDAVFFGEALPAVAMQRAEELVREVDEVLVVGTAGEVEPAASLPYVAADHGARLWEINPDPRLPTARWIVRGAEEVLPELVDRIRDRRAR